MFTNGDHSTTSTETSMVYGSLKKYWRRKRYQRLYPSENYDGDDSGMLFTTSKKKKHYMKVAKFGGEKANTGRGGSWKLRVSPKVRLRKLLVTPVIKMLAGIRNAYINTMLRLAGNVGSSNGSSNVFGGGRIPKARQVKEKKVSKSSKEEFESKLVYEIYKVLAASRQLENSHEGSDALAA